MKNRSTLKISALLLAIVLVFAVLASCTGPMGPKGDRGEPGQTGAPGINGADGNIPYVGENGNWWIGDEDTGVSATGLPGETGVPGESGIPGQTGVPGQTGAPGEDGKTPLLRINSEKYWEVSYDGGKTWESLGVRAYAEIYINEAGYWVIDGVVTNVKAVTETTKAPETTRAPETNRPAATTSRPSTTTRPVTPSSPSPLKDGTLWYYEDFESESLGTNTASVIKALGWSYTSGTSSNTAKFAITDYNGSRQLKITNFENGKAGKDSYATLLPNQLGYLHTLNYTYQYDVNYADSSDAGRYIVMISEYNGSNFYNSGHIRNGGYGNHECYASKWTKYDAAIPSQGDTSIANKLLGRAVGKDALKGVSISIRYSVNWSEGHNIYIRVNTAGYPGSGKWTQVGKFDAAQDAAPYLDPNAGGVGIGLKVGGGQNGYIDNIMIWCGNGEAPKTTDPYVESNLRCHSMIEIEGTERCLLCGKTQAQIDSLWKLSDVPVFDGGACADEVYLSGQGIDPNQPKSSEAKMQIISGTNSTMFVDYTNKLRANGYTLEFSNDAEKNLFRSYVKGTQRVYTYYIAATGETRVICENTSYSQSVNSFGYTYTKKSGDTTEFYQYEMPLRKQNSTVYTTANGYVDRGMLYIVKLADNSVILIDGGEDCQWTAKRLEELWSFLCDITDTPAGGTVRIAAWYLTHGHGDHYQGFGMLLKNYSQSIDLERVMFNLPSTHSSNTTISGQTSGIKKILRYISTYCSDDDVKFIKLHTGQRIQLADIVIDVLYTHEDLVDPFTAQTEADSNYNETSTIIKLTIDQKSFMVLGDVDTKGAGILMQNWSAATLKVDVLQLAHHVLNDLRSLYAITQAPVILVPQSRERMDDKTVMISYYEAAKAYVKNDMCFEQHWGTVGLSVDNGEVKKTFWRDIISYEPNNSVVW